MVVFFPSFFSFFLKKTINLENEILHKRNPSIFLEHLHKFSIYDKIEVNEKKFKNKSILLYF